MSCTLLYISGPNGLMFSTTDEFSISDVPGNLHCGVTMFPRKETVIYLGQIGVHPDAPTIYTSEDKGSNEAQHLHSKLKRGDQQQHDTTWNCNSAGQKVNIPPCKNWSSVEGNLGDFLRSPIEEENSNSLTKKISHNNSKIKETLQTTVEVEVHVPLYNCTPLEQTNRQLIAQNLTVKIGAKLAQCEGMVESGGYSKTTPVQAVVVMQSLEKKLWVVLNNLFRAYSCMVWAKCISQQLCMHRLSLKR
ncbi:hypothetical protein Bbelb_103230 [Branchiostoma belcheri]|nr:hypothetical protein Bbelb_103230 [Branchiostoma belcheri]